MQCGMEECVCPFLLKKASFEGGWGIRERGPRPCSEGGGRNPDLDLPHPLSAQVPGLLYSEQFFLHLLSLYETSPMSSFRSVLG